MQLSETSIQQFIDTWPVARLATLSSENKPHQIPVVFVYYEGRFWSPVDGKPKRVGALARIANAIAHPGASLLIDHYSDDWLQLWWLRVDVELQVVRVNVDATNSIDTATAGVVDALRRKYPQYESTPVLRNPPTLLSMQPLSISSWCATPR